jgi:hypothetical protein
MGGTDKSSSLRFVEGDSTSILEYQESRIALTIVNPSMELCPSEQPDWHGAKLTAFFNAHLGKFIVTCLTTLPRTITRPCSSSSAGMAAIRLLWQIPANVRCQRGGRRSYKVMVLESLRHCWTTTWGLPSLKLHA